MDVETYQYLCEKSAPPIAKTDTCTRQSVSVEEQLAITLASGESQYQYEIQYSYPVTWLTNEVLFSVQAPD